MEPNVLSRRIEQLAELVGDEPEAESSPGGASMATVRGEVSALRGDLVSLRSELGSIRTDLDVMSGRVTGAVAASRTETGVLTRRVAELGHQVEGVGSRVDDLRSDLPSLASEIRDGLELLPLRTGAKLDELTGKLGESVGSRVEAVAGEVRRTVAAAMEREADQAATTQALLGDARSSLESRMAVLEDTLDALAERLESLTRDGAQTTRDQLHAMGASVAAIETRLDAVAGEQVERIVARLRDVTETRLDALSLALVDATRSRNEQLRRELLDVLHRAGTEQEATRNQVALLVEAVRLAEHRQGQVLGALEDRVGTSLDSVREDITTELDEVTERSAAATAQARADAQAEAEAARQRAEDLRTWLEAAVEAGRAQTAAALEEARADLVAEVATLRPDLDELVTSAAAAAAGDAEARAELQHALETVRERVAIAVNVSAESTRSALEELGGAQAERDRTTHEALLDRLEAQHAAVTGRLADLLATQAGGVAATRDTGERLASLATAIDDVRRSVEALQGDWPTRLDEAEGRARSTAEAVVTEVRAEVRAQLDSVLTEMARASGGIEEAKVRLAATTERLAEQSTETRADSRSLPPEPRVGAAPPKAVVKPKPQPAKAVKAVKAVKTPPAKAPKSAPAKAVKVAPKSPASKVAQAPDPLPRKETPANVPAKSAAPTPVTPAPRTGPVKRASLGSMPVVPSPGAALEAAAPTPPAAPIAPPPVAAPRPVREADAPPDEDGRRLFRRRRP